MKIVPKSALLIVIAASAAGCGHHSSWGGGASTDVGRRQQLMRRMSLVLDHIDATDEQRTKIKQVLFKLAPDFIRSRREHREAVQAIEAQWKASRPDARALHALVDARAKALTALAHKVVDTFVEVHGTLTPAQRAKLLEAVHKLRGR